MKLRRFLPGLIGCALVLAATVTAFFVCLRWESRRVCGVLVEECPEENGELDFTLLLDGEKAPYDAPTDTYYIPQDTDKNGWSGKLSVKEGFELCFAPDEMFSYRPSAVEYCHTFALCVSDGNTHDRVNVMFTGLPVLCLDSGGELTLFCPDASAEYGARLVTSRCEFHVRGYESDLWPKKSYKLTLFGENGAYDRKQLLGMRPDDDWVLLPMYNDRTKLREKLALDLWGQIAALSPYLLENGPEAEYVEVFIDGDYAGLYLLSQRMDSKLAGGDVNDTVCLFDGPDIPTAEELALANGFFCRDVEIRSTHAEFSPELWEGCRIWSEAVFFGRGDPAAILRTENILDFYIFNTLVSCPRYGFQSFYLICRDNYGETSFTAVPTDFKFSFGSAFSETEAQNNTEFLSNAAAGETVWPPYEALGENAHALACERYGELKGVLNEENVLSCAKALSSQLAASGALARDSSRWPKSRMGAGEEELCGYISGRLSYMDGLFGGED